MTAPVRVAGTRFRPFTLRCLDVISMNELCLQIPIVFAQDANGGAFWTNLVICWRRSR